MNLHTNGAQLPRSPIPSLKDTPCKVRFDFTTDKGARSSFGVETKSVRIFECPGSGLRFRLPPSSEELEAFYVSQYHEFYGAGSEPEAPKLEYADRVHFLKEHCPGGNVLDIGCSTGVLAEQLKLGGFNAFGCDISQDACELAAERIGAERVFQGTLDEVAPSLDAGSFDAITLMDVIEHFADVVSPLEKMRDLLRPGGVLFLRTPTLTSPFFRIAHMSYWLSLGVYRKAIQKIYHAEHLFYFNERSIRLLLEDTGFEVVTIQRDPLRWRTFSASYRVPAKTTIL